MTLPGRPATGWGELATALHCNISHLTSLIFLLPPQAALGLLPGQPAVPDPNGGEATTAAKALSGAVLNVNFPIGQGQMVQGFYLTHQSLGGWQGSP